MSPDVQGKPSADNPDSTSGLHTGTTDFRLRSSIRKLFPFESKKEVWNFSWCALSGIVVSLPFYRANPWFLSWIGFIPWLLVVLHTTRRKAFWYSYWSGFLFFICTLYWLVHVTLVGLIILCLYLAWYWAFFGYCVSASKRSFSLYPAPTMLFLASIWVVLEFVRSHVLSGFAWALLGYSQYQNSMLIQFADITGALGVSFLVIFVNLCVVRVLTAIAERKPVIIFESFLIVSALFFFVFLYGRAAITQYNAGIEPALRICLVQGNIPQEQKWETLYQEQIKDIYFTMSRQSLDYEPDLIIWPETAYPDYISATDEKPAKPLFDFVDNVNIPLFVGSIYQEGNSYFNGGVLIGLSAPVETVYKKMHLVPFGEYIPLRKYLSWLTSVIPIEDFSRGKESTVFAVRNKVDEYVFFGALICFEDTIWEMSRALRLRGADFLVNITNDAWFKKTASPYQHLQASVFRAIENRVYVVRAANTGITAVIDGCGRAIQVLQDEEGDETFIQGFFTGDIYTQKEMSFYTRFGDLFALCCVLYMVVFALFLKKETTSLPA